MSLVLGIFNDLEKSIGRTGIIIIVCALSMIALFLLANIITAAGKLSKPKLVFKWGQFIMMAICVGLVVWICLTVF